jgi:hypothetical protein
VRAILKDAGFEDITFNTHEEAMRLGQPGQCADAALYSSIFGPMPCIMASLSEEEQRQVLHGVADEYRRLERPDGNVLAGAFWIVTAQA